MPNLSGPRFRMLPAPWQPRTRQLQTETIKGEHESGSTPSPGPQGETSHDDTMKKTFALLATAIILQGCTTKPMDSQAQPLEKKGLTTEVKKPEQCHGPRHCVRLIEG